MSLTDMDFSPLFSGLFFAYLFHVACSAAAFTLQRDYPYNFNAPI